MGNPAKEIELIGDLNENRLVPIEHGTKSFHFTVELDELVIC